MLKEHKIKVVLSEVDNETVQCYTNRGMLITKVAQQATRMRAVAVI
jgi:hypothetical protein